MCKFQQPQIPANVTADERRAICFDALYSLDLSGKVEKYNDLTYLSWANAWAEFKRCYPSATYRIIKSPETNLPYFADPSVGIMVYTEVCVDGITHEMWLPVMNSANKAMKLEPYTYPVWDKDKRPPTTAQVTTRLKRLSARLGFGMRISAHSARKGAAVEAVLAGVPLPVVQALGGWKDINTLQAYVGEALRRTVPWLEILKARTNKGEGRRSTRW